MRSALNLSLVLVAQVDKLREVCKSKGIKGFSKLRKEEMIRELIRVSK